MQITGAELIARSLIACGITHVFNVPGLGIHPLLEAVRQHRDKLRYFTAPSETAVTLMADGYGRASGQPAFVNVYHASGTALGMMGVTTAWADRSPMVFTTTTSSRVLARRDQYASVPGDITDTTRQFVKWGWEVPLVARIPEAIARATMIAATTPKGPVHLAFPMDLYTDTIEVAEAEALLALWAKSIPGDVSGTATASASAAAAARLTRSQRPLIVAGGEVAQSGGVAALVALAERTGAAVFLEPYVAYMGFPNDHPQFLGKFSPGHPLVKDADVVLLAGAELTEGGGPAPYEPGSATVIGVASGIEDVAKQLRPDLTLLGRPASVLEDLLEQLPVSAARSEWRQRIEGARRTYTERLAAQVSMNWDARPVSVPRLTKELEAVFGRNAVIVDHSTTGTACVLQMYDFPDCSRYFGISARASAQGWGTPAAIGIQIARPGERVVVLAGDGGFMFTGSALYAAALWRLPIVVIVLSNGGWYDVAYGAQAKRGWTEEDLRAFGWRLDPPIDHAQFAASLGIASSRVSSVEQLRPALESARDRAGPVMIVVDTDPRAIEYYLDWLQR